MRRARPNELHLIMQRRTDKAAGKTYVASAIVCLSLACGRYASADGPDADRLLQDVLAAASVIDAYEMAVITEPVERVGDRFPPHVRWISEAAGNYRVGVSDIGLSVSPEHVREPGSDAEYDSLVTFDGARYWTYFAKFATVAVSSENRWSRPYFDINPLTCIYVWSSGTPQVFREQTDAAAEGVAGRLASADDLGEEVVDGVRCRKIGLPAGGSFGLAFTVWVDPERLVPMRVLGESRALRTSLEGIVYEPIDDGGTTVHIPVRFRESSRSVETPEFDLVRDHTVVLETLRINQPVATAPFTLSPTMTENFSDEDQLARTLTLTDSVPRLRGRTGGGPSWGLMLSGAAVAVVGVLLFFVSRRR